MKMRVWLFLLSVVTSLAVAESRPQVLVVESYHAEYLWDQQFTAALREQLEPLADLVFFEMNTKRIPPSHHAAKADEAWLRYGQLKPDMVILADDNALRLLGPRFALTSTPVVYLGINQNPRRYFDQPPANISGVLERPYLKRSIAHLNLVMSKRLEKVLVLFDNGTTSRTVLEESFNGEPTQTIGSTEVTIHLIDTFEQWQQHIEHAPNSGFEAVVVGLYHTLTDDQGAHVDEQQVIEWSGRHSQLPLFAFWAFAIGPDMTAGGLVLDGRDQGMAAAEMVRDVLAGHALPRLPVTVGGGSLIFSHSQLARWGITLPDRILRQAQLVP